VSIDKKLFQSIARSELKVLRADRAWSDRDAGAWQQQMKEYEEHDPELARLMREKAAAVDAADNRLIEHLTRALEG
jgi:uncharacterized damage-inducible protein DinB